MDGAKGIDAVTVSLQLKSLLVYEFFKEYTELELLIRKIFEKSLPTLSPEYIQQLYFYLGGKIGSYIEYESHSLKLTKLIFKPSESFRGLSVNQIIKMFKETSYIEAFNFSISSIRSSKVEYSFYDCCTRLINMRNKLAHEVVNLQFKDSDLIDMLTREQIAAESFDALQNYDIQKIDDMTMYIASNIVYIRQLLITLNGML